MNIWARYKGILYDASLKSDSEVIVRTLIKSESDNSFFIKKYPDGTPCYIKYVPKSELEELYEEEEFGTYKGMEFRIVNESPNTYRLSFDYNDYEKEAKQIELCETSGFVKIDKTIYEKEVLKTEVENYRIEKEDLLHK
jgi:hypothetical protein